MEQEDKQAQMGNVSREMSNKESKKTIEIKEKHRNRNKEYL